MTNHEPTYVLPFSATAATEVQLTGGKGATLARLFQEGLPVPTRLRADHPGADRVYGYAAAVHGIFLHGDAATDTCCSTTCSHA